PIIMEIIFTSSTKFSAVINPILSQTMKISKTSYGGFPSFAACCKCLNHCNLFIVLIHPSWNINSAKRIHKNNIQAINIVFMDTFFAYNRSTTSIFY
ncbi:hypothetical protein D6005_23240, partial [Escherichia coli]|nr:hypothetical protein [Escherichia coli]EGE3481372.1 hypothetical protein [Escherichia coli]